MYLKPEGANDQLPVLECIPELCAQVNLQAGDFLLFLEAKPQQTLEEKMICSLLKQIADLEKQAFIYLEKLTAEQTVTTLAVHRLQVLNQELLQALNKAIHAGRYDLNYLEQYQEHAFLLFLKENCFVEKLEAILANF